MKRTVGSSIQLGNHPLLLRIPLTILRHALKRIKGRLGRFGRLAHSHLVAEYSVQRPILDALLQLPQTCDLCLLLFAQGLRLWDFVGLRKSSAVNTISHRGGDDLGECR